MSSRLRRASLSDQPARRGGVVADLLVVLATVGVITTTSLVVVPAAIRAGPIDDTQPVAPSDPDHRLTLDLLASLITRSKGILAVHQRDEGPFLEVLLWLDDDAEPGVVNTGELGLISHSEVSHVLTFTGSVPESAPGPAVTHNQIAGRAFCREWRRAPSARTRVIARSVSDLSLTRLDDTNPRPRIEIRLTWVSGSADGPDKGSTVVDVPGGAILQE